ncbi:MAG TPA: hypothetical protein VK773_12870 [Acidimicrobiales bacterium]|jgi:hypothetical protein|nr:hypothetical protein [Acidimicrobiales bacterium]
MSVPHHKAKTATGESPSARRVIAIGIVCAVVPTVSAVWLGTSGAATTTLGTLKSLACKPMASDPAIEAPLYAQQKGASGESDAWWCQLPHATQVPAGLVPLRRDSAPLPNNYDLDETVYSPRGRPKDAAITAPALVVEVKVNSAVAPGATARVPQFTSARTVVLKKGVTANVVTASGQTDVSWGFTTSGAPKYLSAVSSVTVAGFGVPASDVIAVAKHVAPL